MQIFLEDSVEWYVFCDIDAPMRFSVPVFMMISGAMVLNRSSLLFQYVAKKCMSVVQMILGWNFIVLCMKLCADVLGGGINQSIQSEINTLLFGNSVFWFLYALLPFYLISPVVRLILQNKSIALYTLAVWFAGTVMFSLRGFIPTLAELDFLEYVEIVPPYLGYYLLGGFLHRYQIKRKYENIPICGGMLSFVFSVFLKTAGYFHNFHDAAYLSLCDKRIPDGQAVCTESIQYGLFAYDQDGCSYSGRVRIA